MTETSLPNGWRCGTIGDLGRVERVGIPSDERHDLPYLGLEAIEANTGEILTGTVPAEAPRSVTTHFSPDHVLYGKLRPYLNKVALPRFEGKCSTEIVAIRPTEGTPREFLAYALRRPDLVRSVTERTTGARMPRADMSYVMSFRTPIPPWTEQRQIIDVLSRAEGIMRLEKQAADKAREILPTLFLDLFGNPATNPKGWLIVRMGELLTACDYGTSKKANTQALGVAVIRMGNVSVTGDTELSDLKHVELPKDEFERHRLEKGDLLFNRTNSKELVGKTGIWEADIEAVAASYFIRMRVDKDKVLPHFLWAFMNSSHMKKRLFATARGAIGQANINAQELRRFPVPVPPISAQLAFLNSANLSQSIQTMRLTALARSRDIFTGLLRKQFDGSATQQ